MICSNTRQHQTAPGPDYLQSVSFCLTTSKSQLTLSGLVMRRQVSLYNNITLYYSRFSSLVSILTWSVETWLTFEHDPTVLRPLYWDHSIETTVLGPQCWDHTGECNARLWLSSTDWLQAEDSGAIWALPGNGTYQPANSSPLSHKYNEDISSHSHLALHHNPGNRAAIKEE